MDKFCDLCHFVVGVFHPCTILGGTLCNAFSRVRGLHVWLDVVFCCCFLPCHIGSHMVSSEGLFSFLEGGCCYTRSLKDSPHRTMQCVTVVWCGFSALACVGVLWQSPVKLPLVCLCGTLLEFALFMHFHAEQNSQNDHSVVGSLSLGHLLELTPAGQIYWQGKA